MVQQCPLRHRDGGSRLRVGHLYQCLDEQPRPPHRLRPGRVLDLVPVGRELRGDLDLRRGAGQPAPAGRRPLRWGRLVGCADQCGRRRVRREQFDLRRRAGGEGLRRQFEPHERDPEVHDAGDHAARFHRHARPPDEFDDLALRRNRERLAPGAVLPPAGPVDGVERLLPLLLHRPRGGELGAGLRQHRPGGVEFGLRHPAPGRLQPVEPLLVEAHQVVGPLRLRAGVGQFAQEVEPLLGAEPHVHPAQHLTRPDPAAERRPGHAGRGPDGAGERRPDLDRAARVGDHPAEGGRRPLPRHRRRRFVPDALRLGELRAEFDDRAGRALGRRFVVLRFGRPARDDGFADGVHARAEAGTERQPDRPDQQREHSPRPHGCPGGHFGIGIDTFHAPPCLT